MGFFIVFIISKLIHYKKINLLKLRKHIACLRIYCIFVYQFDERAVKLM